MRLLHARTDQRAVGQGQSSKFDKSTGQVYTETTAAIQCSDDRNWTQNGYEQFSLMDELELGNYVYNIRSCATAKADNEGEIRSLKDVAMRCLVKNISDATPELIRSIPSKLRLQVWEAVKESILLEIGHVLSFHTWSIFSESLRHTTPDPYLYHFYCEIKEPKSPLNVYTTPLASNPLSYITSLSITVPCSVPDLVRLSDIHNLAVLQIIGRKEEAATDRALGVGDRLIRAWHLAALNSGAFPVLRFLRIWYFKNVTEQSLSFLNAFPALALYDVQGCGFSRRSTGQPALGWTLCSDKLFSYTVDRVYRDKILDPSWLGTIGAELEKSEAHDASSQRAKPPPSFGQNWMTFVPRVEVPDMLRSSIFSRRNYYRVMWEEMTYILSPLVGAARNDTDLVSAGYVISDPLAIGNILGSSIPMVSLRIGTDSESSFDLNPVAFIRDNLLDPLNLNGCENGHEVSEQGRQSARRQTTKTKRQGQGVIQTKKRKLNDLLSSLL